jgi:hypothetical protein
MRYKLAGVAVVALALAFSAVPQAGQAAKTGASAQKAAPAAAQKLPPLSYVCPMPQDAEVVEDKPGKCPKCGMELQPVRLDSKWWCPVHQALEVHDGPGKCRRDGRDLVQVTLAEFWTCADAADKKLLEPGSCGDGTPRKIGYELRAHGDHNPRHGGQFFMASDAWHHLEGTYPENGLFRVFFYDNFTKPLSAKGVAGSVVIRDKNDKEIASAPLAIAKNPTTMEAKIPAADAALPLRATVKMKFTPTMAEQPFDFQFNEYSKDTAPAGTSIGPTATPRPTTTGAAAPPKPAATATASASSAPKPPAAASSAPAPSTAAAASQESGTTVIAPPPGSDPFAGEIAPMPPALAAALNEDVLPKDVPGLVAELTNRAGQIDSLVRDGSLSEVWLPAMGTKTVALVLESHAGSLPAAKQAVVHEAVMRVVSAAWEIDGYGDLGNKTKIVEAYDHLKTAVNDLKGAYEGAR